MKPNCYLSRCVVIILLWVSAHFAEAKTFDWQGEPLTEVQLETVAFRGWIPEINGPLRGTLVLIPGRHGDGRGMANDKRWQELAHTLHFAILACQFTNGDPGLYQHDKKGEVARAINDAVGHLGGASTHPELTKTPLAFWGTSAGSNVSSRYCVHFPKRVAAFASSKGTWGASNDISTATTKIPMLFAIGSKDKAEWVKYSLDNIKRGISRRAPWITALSKTEGHSVGKSLDVAIPFLEAVVKQRLGIGAVGANPSDRIFKTARPALGNSSERTTVSVNLNPIDKTKGWLGDPKSGKIARYKDFRGGKSKATWLPDEATAKAWQKYVQ